MVFTIGKKYTEEQFLKGCQMSDEKLRNETYKAWAPYMKGVCIRYVADHELAEDIMHDAFIKVFVGVGNVTWRGDGSFKGWVVRIMVNCCIDHLKTAKRLPSLSIDYVDDIAEDYDDTDESTSLLNVVREKGVSREELVGMLESLPESHRVVFNMYAIEMMRHKEISELLGITEEASRKRLGRARLQLRELLTDRYRLTKKQ